METLGKDLLLRVECKPCVIYGKGRSRGEFLLCLYKEILEEWKRVCMLEGKTLHRSL